MKTTVQLIPVFALAWLYATAAHAQGREWKIYENERLGYALRIPAEFVLQSEGETTTWVYQPPAVTPVPVEDEPRRISVNLGPINLQFDDPNDRRDRGRRRGDRPPPPPPVQEPPIAISVSWTWNPDKPSETLFRAVRSTDEQEAKSPSPDIVDIRDFDMGSGYAYEGDTYWFRERDKPAPGDQHRWVARSFGNWSTYTVEIVGAYARLSQSGPVFEDVIRSFRLIPMDR